jgi:hypothetical protein
VDGDQNNKAGKEKEGRREKEGLLLSIASLFHYMQVKPIIYTLV